MDAHKSFVMPLVGDDQYDLVINGDAIEGVHHGTVEVVDPDIAARVVEAERLETEVHEALHACMPDIDEEAIHDTARDVAAVLWALGYRCQ